MTFHRVKSNWNLVTFLLLFYFTEAFNAFVGLDGAKDCTEQRSEVSFCLNFLVALLRRVSLPTDLLKCRNSGFIDTSVTGKCNQELHYFKKKNFPAKNRCAFFDIWTESVLIVCLNNVNKKHILKRIGWNGKFELIEILVQLLIKKNRFLKIIHLYRSFGP